MPLIKDHHSIAMVTELLVMSRTGLVCVLLASAALLAIGALVAVASGWLTTPSAGDRPVALFEGEEQEQTPFAADRAGAAGEPVALDGKRAMSYLKTICDIGPRISDTAGMKEQQELLRKHFEALGAKVETQAFTARQNSKRDSVDMTNLIVSWQPERKRRVLVCSHYDTRPIADQEPDPRKWRDRFLSANDGGSGVAFLMELGNHMTDLKTEVGVDFVFFDGEEYVFNKTDKYFFGSERYGQEYRRNRSSGRVVTGAVLLDMIGGKKPRFPIEGHSWWMARQLTQQLWKIAEEQHCPAFHYERGPDVLDDHMALNRAGIPAVDIIDFDYPHWHRLSDTPENCSPEGLEQVGRVVSVWLQRAR
jgi:glutaminyl-peptide cyclotransferase